MDSLSNMGGGNPSGFELRENIPESKQVPWLSRNSKWLEKPIVRGSLPSHARERPSMSSNSFLYKDTSHIGSACVHVCVRVWILPFTRTLIATP